MPQNNQTEAVEVKNVYTLRFQNGNVWMTADEFINFSDELIKFGVDVDVVEQSPGMFRFILKEARGSA